MARRHALIALLGCAVVAGWAAWWSQRPEPADTRFSGAYAMSDGTQVFIAPNAGTSLRYRRATEYEPDYFASQIEWLRRQSLN